MKAAMSGPQPGKEVRASARVRLAGLAFMVLLLGMIAMLATVLQFNGSWIPTGIALVFAEAALLLGFAIGMWRAWRRTSSPRAGMK